MTPLTPEQQRLAVEYYPVIKRAMRSYHYFASLVDDAEGVAMEGLLEAVVACDTKKPEQVHPYIYF